MPTDANVKCHGCDELLQEDDTALGTPCLANASVKIWPCKHVYHIICCDEGVKRCPICLAVRNKVTLLTAGGLTIGAALAPEVAPAALGLVGFTSIGPVAGSMAAAMQSSIGNVAAGSLFATAQSISMGGAIPTIVSGIGGLTGAGLGRLSVKVTRLVKAKL
ncbi:hypothetical protein FOMPIDRAFT_1024943 [Fomitopsis schrenkii]|uniref:RING-type domain-containing protein n=1 Tax=Fomitopsis schrenkii TaxID=2126942 RepID=S8FGX1_FOMSC|nr:hypothetical protein FOMPIDRAFT_1024943 [Fomitopsis schrenkii]